MTNFIVAGVLSIIFSVGVARVSLTVLAAAGVHGSVRSSALDW